MIITKKNELMQVDGFNKSIYHRLTPSELTAGLPLIVTVKNQFSYGENYGEVTNGTLQSER